MTGPEQLATQVRLATEYAVPNAPIRRGVIVTAAFSGDGYLVTVNISGREQTFGDDVFSSVFRAELDTMRTVNLVPMEGRKVEIHYSAGQMPVIAYTVGV